MKTAPKIRKLRSILEEKRTSLEITRKKHSDESRKYD